MDRNFRLIKTFIAVWILILCVFTAASPITSAGILDKIAKAYILYSEIQIDYNKSAAEAPILPITRVKEIPVYIKYRVNGFYADEMVPYYKNIPNYINIYVEKTPGWCTAGILPPVLEAYTSTNWTTINATLTISVDENASAFLDGTIKIAVKVPLFGTIQGGIFHGDIRFIPGYLPLLRFDFPTGTSKTIEPRETANFDIEIENLGNAKTEVTCRVLDPPKGWTVDVTPSTTVGSKILGDNPKQSIQLVVKPPYDFGIHNDREVIQVVVTPSHFSDPNLKGEDYILSFAVQSRGFSTPGFELTLVLLALPIISITVKKHRGKENRSNRRKV